MHVSVRRLTPHREVCKGGGYTPRGVAGPNLVDDRVHV